MKKHKKRYWPWILLMISLILAGGYLAMGFYYLDGFGFGTWVNGLYCTGKSVYAVNEELLDNYNYSEVLVMLYDGEEIVQESLTLTTDIVQADFVPQLNQLLASQNPMLWGESLLTPQKEGGDQTLYPTLVVSQDNLRKALLELPAIYRELHTSHGLTITKTEKGFLLTDTLSHVLDIDKAVRIVYEAVSRGEEMVDLTTQDCYYDLPETDEILRTRLLWNQIESFQNCQIVYDMGDKLIALDASIVGDWIVTDGHQQPVLDEAGKLQVREYAIEDFINSLAAEYNTYGVERPFTTTQGESVMVEGLTYGTEIDTEAEIAYLKDAFANRVCEVHIPKYLHETPHRGKDDIGDTYIEIDISNQTMYYYIDGELFVETPIVTGNMLRKMGTPSAVCYVYGKQKNRTLRGPGYASFVKYWLPVKGGIGIHDASWRKNFGGDIYLKNGSHGCINTPNDVMEQIYERVEIGTPVIMFYS
ncbi:MAG: L,D-transpeptidase family protein [Lachnospiraceae bacterium]|nr:L,D-transpeptidase family protein [Lachnospiraceae bacterium]